MFLFKCENLQVSFTPFSDVYAHVTHNKPEDSYKYVKGEELRDTQNYCMAENTMYTLFFLKK